MELETERTWLRTFGTDDLDDLHEYTSQPEVGEMAGWKPHTSINESLHTLKLYLKNPNVAAIVSKKDGNVIGHIAVYEDTKNKKEDAREFGFALNRNYQGQGIMAEVLKAVLEKLLADGVQEVYACCKKGNVPAAKLLTACGFAWEREGEIFSRTMKQSFASCEYVYRVKQKCDRTVGAVLMNLVMVRDGDKVLVQNRLAEDYKGITFPGGHVEAGESLTDAAIREVYEETGLTIAHLRLCGIKDWEEAGVRYLVFCYCTEQFCGTLHSSEEGEVFWASLKELPQMKLAEDMENTLKLFSEENLCEYHFVEKSDGSYEGVLL